MSLGPLKSFSVQYQAIEHKKWLMKTNRRLLTAVSGPVGVGKTTFCYQYVKANLMTFQPEDILRRTCIYEGPIERIFKEASALPAALARYSAFWIDEGTDIANAQDWQTTFAKSFNSFLNKSRKAWQEGPTGPIRKGNNSILICMPDFQEFNARIRRKFDRWIWVFEPGKGLVFKKSNAPFGDNWRKDEMLKIYNDFLDKNDLREDKVRFEDIIRIYGNLPICLGVVTFPRMTDEEERIYETIHSERQLGTPEELIEGRQTTRLRLTVGRAGILVNDLASTAKQLMEEALKDSELSAEKKTVLEEFSKLSTIAGRAKMMNLSTSGLFRCEELARKAKKQENHLNTSPP